MQSGPCEMRNRGAAIAVSIREYGPFEIVSKEKDGIETRGFCVVTWKPLREFLGRTLILAEGIYGGERIVALSGILALKSI